VEKKDADIECEQESIVQCMVKKEWIIDVETQESTIMDFNLGRAMRCTMIVLPEFGKSEVTVEEFKRICKENNV
jgi:hypothetical protein